ncbi:hypothetical protein K6V92_10490 [Cupriavidus respiraculi]|uniref:hypothetical protein n=1 Tax=Cupriavidus respiraculi TaxID=195930 RepID=UPI001C9595CA|nr:hypothetical protein [Cupriavidus respiraculi]MBY4947046.1 hypothetical protein [Cupriavidus respiraculi]
MADNPYLGKGPLEEAWHRGFHGERGLAAPGSNYDKVWHEGAAARKAYDAGRAAPADKQGVGLSEADMDRIYNDWRDQGDEASYADLMEAVQSAILARVAPSGEPVGHVYSMEALVPGASRQYHAQLYVNLPVGTKLYAAPQPSEKQAETAKQRYDESGCAQEETSPLDRLRFFCSLAMTCQDWLDAEPFFDALPEQPAEEARGVGDVRQRFERIKRLALDAGGQGALPVPQSLQKIVRECIDGAALLAAPAAATAQDKPVAWVRYRSDGGFEGPIMDSDPRICDTRRSFWSPLYAAPQAAHSRQPEGAALTDGEIAKVLNELRDIAMEFANAHRLPLLDRASESRAEGRICLLADDHSGMRVDYQGLFKQSQSALRREPGLAEMLRQLQAHMQELGRRWYSGDTAVVDELLQLYCVERDSRAALAAQKGYA